MISGWVASGCHVHGGVACDLECPTKFVKRTSGRLHEMILDAMCAIPSFLLRDKHFEL